MHACGIIRLKNHFELTRANWSHKCNTTERRHSRFVSSAKCHFAPIFEESFAFNDRVIFESRTFFRL